MKHLLVVILLYAIAVPVVAQAPAGPPKPGPEVQKLDYFTGVWKITGEMKPSPFGPGGKFDMSEKNTWFAGRFFVISRSYGILAGLGRIIGESTYGYDTERKQYTYHAINSFGEEESAVGHVDGDLWTWTSEGTVGGKTLKQRFTIKVESPIAYSMKFETSEDGAHWNTVMEGNAQKTTPAGARLPIPSRQAPTPTPAPAPTPIPKPTK